MLVLLSPSKTLDETPVTLPIMMGQPDFLDDSALLIEQLRGFSVRELMQLMGISDKLAELNVARYQSFSAPFHVGNAKAALFMFKGDVYEPLSLDSYSREDLDYANAHLRILSGLYGLLRPLDLMQPYRLEMGTRLKNLRGKDLYAFWGMKVTQAINDVITTHSSRLVVNLASQEYFKVVKPAVLSAPLVDITFLDQKGSAAPKTLGLYAKQARGMMADFIIRQRVDSPEGLKDFSSGNYHFDASRSDAQTLTFLRHH